MVKRGITSFAGKHVLLLQGPLGHIPFFGGTYFPKEPRYGMPAFTDICRRVAQYYREHRAEVEIQNASVLAAFRRSAPAAREPACK